MKTTTTKLGFNILYEKDCTILAKNDETIAKRK